MQTASPRNSMGSHSPRTIDFTNPDAGAKIESGTRQIPLQDLPFGQRSQDNFDELWDQATEGADDKNKTAGQKFWDKISKPFRKNTDSKPFQFPTNMNRKPNYNNGQVLTDQKPNPFKMPNLFKKPMALEQPMWMKQMNQKTKEMFSFNKRNQNNENWNDPFAQTNDTWRERNSQAWQKFSRNLNPQNWKMPGNRNQNVNPPLRQANNWLDNMQTQDRFRR